MDATFGNLFTVFKPGYRVAIKIAANQAGEMLVQEVVARSMADRSGSIKVGDIILEINGQAIGPKTKSSSNTSPNGKQLEELANSLLEVLWFYFRVSFIYSIFA